MVTFSWDDATKGNNIMFRVPRNIKLNDNIVVREDEIAVFVRDGKTLAYFDRPGRYALTSLNDPIIAPIVKFLTGVQQVAEVYYVQRRPFDAKFGSKQPYQFKDKDFGLVNLRLFGESRYRVKDAGNFINEFVGTRGLATATEVEDRIREQIVLITYDVVGDAKNQGIGVTDLASNLTNFEQAILERAKQHFDPYGLIVEKISGLYVSIPEEVQKAVDQRASMQVLGASYMQYQTGQAMREAAANPAGGGAGAGIGLGAGIGMGYTMVDAMRQQQAQPGGPPAAGTPCIKCGQPVPPGQQFCGACGARQLKGVDCPKCGTFVPETLKFCGNCGTKIGVTCSKCGADVPPGLKFCGKCGTAVGG